MSVLLDTPAVCRHLSDFDRQASHRSAAVRDDELLTHRRSPLPRYESAMPGGGKLVIEGEAPWLKEALVRLGELCSMRENWDSYGARPITTKQVSAAIEFLRLILPPNGRLPDLIPTVNGRVQFEWHAHGIDLEVEVLGFNRVEVLYENAATGETWDGTMSSDLGKLKRFVSEASRI